MRTFKLICKGVLLYVTILATILIVCSIDSLFDNGYFLKAILIMIALISICYKTISEEEIKILILSKYINNGIDNDPELN